MSEAMIPMPSYQISLTPHKRAAGRFISTVRREIQKALAEEHASRGVTQSFIANALDVNRSVIHRQIIGFENLTLGRVAEIAEVLDRIIVFALVKPDECSNFFKPALLTSQTMTKPLQSAAFQTASGTTTTHLQAILGKQALAAT